MSVSTSSPPPSAGRGTRTDGDDGAIGRWRIDTSGPPWRWYSLGIGRRPAANKKLEVTSDQDQRSNLTTGPSVWCTGADSVGRSMT